MKHLNILIGIFLLLVGVFGIQAQTSVRNGNIYLYDGSRRANTTNYKTPEACLEAAKTLVEKKRETDKTKPLISARCVSTTYTDNKPTTVVVVPTPGLGRLPANPVVNVGFSEVRVNTSGGGEPENSRDGTGNFRTRCTLSHYGFNDPIVYPGQPGRSHLHAFLGNTSTDAYTTGQNIRSKGGSTCRGGTANLSSYWIPALIDTTTNLPVNFEESNIYYKSAYKGIQPRQVNAIPTGLVMLAGDANNTTPDPWTAPYEWKCHNMPYPSNRGPSIPASCPPGDQLELSIFFPQCHDGVNLDSPDHKSHMAYGNGQGCPASHPVALPEVSFHILWPVPADGSTRNWRLSSDTYSGPAGYSAHADFMMGWDPAIAARWTAGCVIGAKDCGSHQLSGGWSIY